MWSYSHTLCKCSSHVLQDVIRHHHLRPAPAPWSSSPELFPQTIMADRLINIKLSAPGWHNRPPLNSRQLSNAMRQWCHLIPAGHGAAHLDSDTRLGDTALVLFDIHLKLWKKHFKGQLSSWQHRLYFLLAGSVWCTITLKAEELVHSQTEPEKSTHWLHFRYFFYCQLTEN